MTIKELLAEDDEDTDLTAQILGTLQWMVEDMDARRDQGPNGLDADPLSPRMQLAHQLLDDLLAGKIWCRRDE